MVEPDRRRFMGMVSLASLAGWSASGTAADAGEAAGQAATDRFQIGTDVTRSLAGYVVSAKYADIPAPVRKEAQRTLLNWVGCAVGGSRHETLDAAIAALAPFSGPPQASGARPCASGWTFCTPR